MKGLTWRFPTASLWLALVLFASQVCAVFHATQHELASQDDQPACEICVVAHGAGALPAAHAPTSLVAGSDAFLHAYVREHDARRTLERPRSRAPPILI